MANVEGTWKTVIKTPMGKRRGTLTVRRSGDNFTGSYSGDLGNSEISSGKISGDTISCSIEATKPMRMPLAIEATVIGDTIDGAVKSEAFGSFSISGERT